jgi:hypothetical protein
MGKWYFRGNAHALNEPNSKRKQQYNNPKNQDCRNSQERKSKIKIQNLEKNVKKQSRTCKAKQNQKHKTTQSSPESLLSKSACSLYGELFDFGLGREFLSAVAAASATVALSSRAISTRRRASPCGGFKYSRTNLSPS